MKCSKCKEDVIGGYVLDNFEMYCSLECFYETYQKEDILIKLISIGEGYRRLLTDIVNALSGVSIKTFDEIVDDTFYMDLQHLG